VLNGRSCAAEFVIFRDFAWFAVLSFDVLRFASVFHGVNPINIFVILAIETAITEAAAAHQLLN